MAMTSYLKVEGKEQGSIEGDCTQKGRENTILVYSMDHKVEIPRDTHTGLPTGQRIHKPLQIIKHKDKSSPKLFQACCSGEQLKAELKFFRINEKGQEEHYYTIKVDNAIIVEMQEYTPLTFLDMNKPYKDMESVLFTYEKIIWTYEPDGIETEDSWNAPKS
ncbi:MAG: Hcp family type VI secretion system effector [Desulfobacula sp.]|jgi:type VI secretion system secreted protein Hcp|nr:Hcp family type VI secretion system effector [Desulfobacula sp.]OGQ89788.1 MAG: type VI secretion protein [Deltaproteobacteria bacterium RIFOXYC2_FULL_48_10]